MAMQQSTIHRCSLGGTSNDLDTPKHPLHVGKTLLPKVQRFGREACDKVKDASNTI